MKFKTQYNSHEFPKRYETIIGKSKTIPDQSLTVRQIMDRYARGLPLEGRFPIYNGEDDDMPDLSRLDLAERQEVIEEMQSELDAIKKRQEAAKSDKHKAKLFAKMKKELEQNVLPFNQADSSTGDDGGPAPSPEPISYKNPPGGTRGSAAGGK